MRYCYLAGFLLILISGTARAQDSKRCDCALQNLGAYCYPTISQNGKWIRVTSNVPECSRVDWYADDQLQVTLVKNHAEEVEWLESNRNPVLSVLSCRICTTDRSTTTASMPQTHTIPIPSDVESQPASPDISGTWNCYEAEHDTDSADTFIAIMTLTEPNGTDYLGSIQTTTTGENDNSGAVFLTISKAFEFTGALKGTSLTVQYADDSSSENWTVSDELIYMPEGWNCTR